MASRGILSFIVLLVPLVTQSAVPVPPGDIVELLTSRSFLKQHYGKDIIHITEPNPPRADYLSKLWSQGDMEDWLASQKHELVIGKDVDVSTGGNRIIENELAPPQWRSIYKGLIEGGTLIVNNIRRHPNFYALGNALSFALGVIVDVNIYVSPPPLSEEADMGEAGFNYHYDADDILILQHQGRKRWAVCERRYPLHLPSVVRNVEKALGLTKGFSEACSNITLSAGETLYLPFGSFHKAWSLPGPTTSTHSTVSLRTGLINWHKTYELVLHDPVLFAHCTERQSQVIEDFLFEDAEIAFPEAKRIGPLRTVAMRMSINNDDLPIDALEKVAEELKGHLDHLVPRARKRSLRGCGGKIVAKHLESLLKSNLSAPLKALSGRVLEQLRIDLVGKTPRPPISLALGPLTLDTVLRRPQTTFTAVTQMDGRDIMAVMNEGLPLKKGSTVAMARWCLAWNDKRGAQGKAFAVRDVSAISKSAIRIDNKDRLEVAKFLLGLGVLQMVEPVTAGRGKKEEL